MTELEDFNAERQNFLVWSLGSAGLTFAADCMGRSVGSPLLRLGLVIAFFTGLACVLWSFTDPLQALLRAHFLLRYRDAGPNVSAAAARLVTEIGHVARSLSHPLLLVLSVSLLRVLVYYPQFAGLRVIQGSLPGLWALTVVGFLVQLSRSTNRLGLLFGLHAGIRRQLEIAGQQPLSAADYRAEAERLAASPVIPLDTERFDCGGITWSWTEFRTNAVILGQTGSGKTVTVLNSFLEGLFATTAPPRSDLPVAALILDPKGDFADKLRQLCSRLGRSADLVVFDPSSPATSATWNPLDAPEDGDLELAGGFAAVLKLLGMKTGNDSFFIDQAKLFLRHAIALLRASALAPGPPNLAEIYSLSKQASALEARLLLLSLADAVRRTDPANTFQFGQLADMAQNPATLKVLVESVARPDAGAAATRVYFAHFESLAEFEQEPIIGALRSLVAEFVLEPIPNTLGPAPIDSQDFVLNAWFSLPDKTRDSVRAQLSTMLDPFLIEPYRRLLSGHSTITMGQLLDEGRIFYVRMPVADGPEMSRTLNTLIKLAFFRAVLQRLNKPRPSLFLCDEFQKFFTADAGSGDAGFFEISRQSNHVSLIATQSVAALKREVDRQETVDSLLTNCGVKIFLRNGDPGTNEYAEKLCGTYPEVNLSFSQNTGQGGGRRGMASGGFSVNEATEQKPRFGKDVFARLAIPTREPGQDHAEAIAVLGARQPPEVRRLRFKVNPL